MAQAFIFSLISFVTVFLPLVSSQSGSASFPAFVPLALRTPYLNCWTNTAGQVKNWPSFWSGQVRTAPRLVIARLTDLFHTSF